MTVNRPLTEALTLTVPSSFGADGSYLEVPAQFTSQPGDFASGSASGQSLSVTSGLSPLPAPPAGGALTATPSDVPPGRRDGLPAVPGHPAKKAYKKLVCKLRKYASVLS